MMADLTDPTTVRAVARRVGLTIKPDLGQHFLVDRDVLGLIVAALDASGADVLEIGCGVGTLTAEIASVAARVIAIDVDPACVRATRLTQRGHSNLTVVQEDARLVDPAAHGLRTPWLAAGNLPYQLTGIVLGRFFELGEPPSRAVFLVQREVAARIAAAPGDWSLATVALRSVARVERLHDVAPGSFDPPPAVHSSIVRLTPERTMPPEARRDVIHLARLVFQQRRKTLRHGMTHALGGDAESARRALAVAGIDPGLRPGTLSLDMWQRLADAAGQVRGRHTETR